MAPANDHEFQTEILSATPTSWYLTGFLVPANAGRLFASMTMRRSKSMRLPPQAASIATPPVYRSDSGNNYIPFSIGMTKIIPADTKTVTLKVE